MLRQNVKNSYREIWRLPWRMIFAGDSTKEMMVEGRWLPEVPSTITSTLGKDFSTATESRAGVSPRGLAEVRRSGPVWDKIDSEKRG